MVPITSTTTAKKKGHVKFPPTTSASLAMSNDAIIPGPDKATVFMIQSLEQMQSTLICPLCQQMLTDPSTLACAHTFCWKCIEAFSCNNSLCPVPGCGIPLSMTGSRQGSFLKTNPSLETVLSSFHTICQALEKAPTKWWQNNNSEDQDTMNVNANDNKPSANEDNHNNSHARNNQESSNHDDDDNKMKTTTTKTNSVMFDVMDMDDDDSTSSDETVNFNSTRHSQNDTNDRNGEDFDDYDDGNDWAKQINIDSGDDENNDNGYEDERN